ncbi:Membrane transporter [Perkinsela sp. CCAP 1560/4]|nr:Membrane transporter [Perkinsela sp. CCAP 1560/4]|eukprot:KNH07723.1 Membrane transporter [Perkinsela sp. CCAP 1560/4]
MTAVVAAATLVAFYVQSATKQNLERFVEHTGIPTMCADTKDALIQYINQRLRNQPKAIDAPKYAIKPAAEEKDPTKKEVTLLKRFIYTLSVLNVAITVYLVGAHPLKFYLLQGPQCIILLAIRWYTFREQKQHYLLYDLCYWANFLCIIYPWCLADSAKAFQIIFILANGPIAWSVLVFSQSLVFHSPPHMTSIFIHISPMLLSYCIRWYGSETSQAQFAVCDNFPVCDDISQKDLLISANVYFYVWWCILYYIWVFIVLSDRIKSRGYQTLFDRVVRKWPAILNISKLDWVRKFVYVFIHFVLSNGAMVVATYCWSHFWAHVGLILLISGIASWNAAGHYSVSAMMHVPFTHRRRKKQRASALVASNLPGNVQGGAKNGDEKGVARSL